MVCAVWEPHIALVGMVDIVRGALESMVDKVKNMPSTTMCMEYQTVAYNIGIGIDSRFAMSMDEYDNMIVVFLQEKMSLQLPVMA
jgi:hypothetical protein